MVLTHQALATVALVPHGCDGAGPVCALLHPVIRANGPAHQCHGQGRAAVHPLRSGKNVPVRGLTILGVEGYRRLKARLRGTKKQGSADE